jgi:hypothetical protein
MMCPECGAVIDAAEKTPRSVPQLRRYFALVRAVYEHWPEHHARQFASAEECRKWLQIRAGHYETGAAIPLTGTSKERAVMLAEAAIRAAGSYAEPVIHGDTLVIRRPKSIAFGRLGHAAACRLMADVDEVIRAETGLDPDQMLDACARTRRAADDERVAHE